MFFWALYFSIAAIVSGQEDLQPRCDELLLFDNFSPALELRTISKITDEAAGQGTVTIEATLTGLSWIGIGWSPNAKMVPGFAVIGNDEEILKWDMFAYSTDLSGLERVPQERQTLLGTSFVQNETHSILRFTKILQEEGELALNGGGRNLIIWAHGLLNDNTIGYHGLQNRGVRSVNFEPCSGGDEVTFAPAGASPTRAPSQSLAPISRAPSDHPSTSLHPTQSLIDCTQFQQSITLDRKLSMDYVVFTSDEDGESYLKARMAFQGQAWLSFGISPLGSPSMIPGNAVIGIPEADDMIFNPGKYTMNDRALAGVRLFPDAMQTLVNAEIYQDKAVTILNFTKKLVEEGELPINSDGTNTFMWAYGFSNDFITHEGRGAFDLRLRTCSATAEPFKNDGFTALDTGSSQQSLWTAHGVFAALAWGLFSPLAIGASMLRHRLPAGPLWLKIHFYLHLLVVGMSLIAFFIAVAAHQEGTPSGTKPAHFTGLLHRSLGLAIIIFSLIQVAGGILRAPAQKKNDDGSVYPKSQFRLMWEVGHKGLGVALLSTCWYQCADGLSLYAANFGTAKLFGVFWIVTGVLSGSIVAVLVWDKWLRGKLIETPMVNSSSKSEATSVSATS